MDNASTCLAANASWRSGMCAGDTSSQAACETVPGNAYSEPTWPTVYILCELGTNFDQITSSQHESQLLRLKTVPGVDINAFDPHIVREVNTLDGLSPAVKIQLGFDPANFDPLSFAQHSRSSVWKEAIRTTQCTAMCYGRIDKFLSDCDVPLNISTAFASCT